MSLSLEIERGFTQRSEAVIAVDFHAKEPWLLACQPEKVCLWNFKTEKLLKSIEVFAASSAKFIRNRECFVVGVDMCIRVYSYVTSAKLKEFKAHQDRITCLTIHPSLPYLLSSSDDKLMKLWDWEDEWNNIQTFKGHSGGINHAAFNLIDKQICASASVDGTAKVWRIGSEDPICELTGNDAAVTYVGFYVHEKMSYLIISSDCLLKVWDWKANSCIQTISHTHSIFSGCFCLDLPLFLTGSEDGSVAIWHTKTYRLEKAINYGLKGIHAMSYNKTLRWFVIGCEAGLFMIQIDREFPLHSMNTSGKILRERSNAIEQIEGSDIPETEVVKGDKLVVKRLGMCDFCPEILKSNPDGKSVALTGGGEYSIYNTTPWNNKSNGQALEFVWSATGACAIMESESKIFYMKKTYQVATKIDLPFKVLHIFGGTLFAACSSDFICFYNWAEFRLICRLKNVKVTNIYWAGNNDLVAVISDASFQIFRYHRSFIGMSGGEDGIENSFQLLYTVKERVRTGIWDGNSFIYINSAWALNSCLHGQVNMVCHLNHCVKYLDCPMQMFGCHGDKLYLVDKNYNIVKYALCRSLIKFMELILLGKLERANVILPTIPKDHHNCVAYFLKSLTVQNHANLDIPGMLRALQVDKVTSAFNQIGLSELIFPLRDNPIYDFEFSWKYQYFLGRYYILPAVRNQGRASNCVLQALSAAGEILLMREAALKSETTDIKILTNEFSADYEEISGPIPYDTEGWKRLEKGLEIFEKEGVRAEGGGEAPGRRKIASSKCKQRLDFDDVAEIICDGRPVIGTIKIDDTFGKMGRNKIYEFDEEKRKVTRDGSCRTASHCIVFVGFGWKAGRPYLVFLNSHGTEFGEDGFGRVYFNEDMRFTTMEI